MDTILDIYNKILYFKDEEIKFIFDIDDVVWFKFSNIATILEYKDRNDVLKKHVDKKYRKHFKNIKTNHILDKQKPDTVYITESGLYKLLIRSRMKKAEKFQEWLIEEALPKLRKYGKYEVNTKMKKKLKDMNEKMKILEKTNLKLIKNMTNKKYPKGYHFYVIEDDKMYKIGYCKDLTSRLSTYNTGKANKAEYAYYKKTDCAKQIEECMKALLNKYIYKANKEFYNCSLNTIIKNVKKCLIIENNCSKCSDIKNNINQQGGKNYIIEELLDEIKTDYNNIITSMKY